MRAVSGREFARLAERHGWQLLRVNGSHHIYGKSGSIVRLSIPIHANRPLKRGLLRLSPARLPRCESWRREVWRGGGFTDQDFTLAALCKAADKSAVHT